MNLNLLVKTMFSVWDERDQSSQMVVRKRSSFLSKAESTNGQTRQRLVEARKHYGCGMLRLSDRHNIIRVDTQSEGAKILLEK